LPGLEHNKGGKEIILKHVSQCRFVPVDDQGVVLDIDTADELRRFARL